MRSEWESAESHLGVVVKIDGDMATLRFARGKMCARCGACLAVGACEMEMTLPNSLGAAVGEAVSVELSGKMLAGASLIAYGIPLLLLLGGVWLGSRLSDLMALLGGLAGCALSFGALKIVNLELKRRNAFQPVMREILSPPSRQA